MPKQKSSKKETPSSLKGMRDILESEYFAYQGFFEKASEIALYYGFRPIELPILETEELFAESIGEETDMLDKEMYSLKTKNGTHLAMRPEGTVSVMRAYVEHAMSALPQPVMLYYFGPFFRHFDVHEGVYREFRQFGLEIIGTTKSIADATIIKVSMTILEEAGFKNLRIRINSVGDKESQNAYAKELTSYYKKNIENLCASCRQKIKTEPLKILECKNEKCQSLKGNTPDSISCLSTAAKKHFKEVLEYLDAMNIVYEIDSRLSKTFNYYTQTVFEIVEPTSEKIVDSTAPNTPEERPLFPLAGGGRYDNLAKQINYKKDIPSVGAALSVDRVIESPLHKPIDPRILKKPKVYFIQFGFEAKLKSLAVIEILRKARIPIMHSLARDRLSGQLAVAEKLMIPFTIILGQREALDNTVIVRNMETRSQDTISINDLPDYIKKKVK